MSRPAGLLAGPLPLAAVLALRYLRSTRRDAYASFLSAVAAGGIALGVAALVLALAALSGFQEALRGEIVERTSEIEVALPAGSDAAAIAAELAALPGVRGVQRLLRGRGWLSAAGQIRPVEVVGYERSPPRAFPGAAAAAGVHLGDRLAASLGLEPGGVVELASLRPTLTPLGPQPRVRRLPLAGTFATGRAEQEHRVALPLAVAIDLFGDRQPLLEVSAGGLDAAVKLAPALTARLPEGTRVETWRELNRALFFALRLEKTLMFLAVLLIVVVAALALISDLSLVIASKRAEVGMLQAMGLPLSRIERAFVLLGGLLAGGGAAAGTLAGVTLSWLLDRYRLLSLPGDVYFLDYVPFWVRGGDLAAVLGVTLALVVGFTVLASRRLAGLTPVEALRR